MKKNVPKWVTTLSLRSLLLLPLALTLALFAGVLVLMYSNLNHVQEQSNIVTRQVESSEAAAKLDQKWANVRILTRDMLYGDVNVMSDTMEKIEAEVAAINTLIELRS
ncbi:hypothetical protein JCM19238_5134 [Vibrio ponticus]|nr:hypothetical protein JCM19238_5134 [Vibrio ponticus]